MNLSYDPDADSLWIRWNESPIDESDEVEPGVILDYDADGVIVGIEVLNASKKIENLSSISTVKSPA